MTNDNFTKLVEVMKRLRGKDGCPWDSAQTVDSIKPYLIEETYEVLSAIEQREPAAIKEELGDLLLQIIFQAQLWDEQNEFSIHDVIAHAREKMIRRHPHVFSTTHVESAKQVLVNWEAIKQKEKNNSQRHSILDGVPNSLPALLMAQRVQEKVSRVGFDWDDPAGPWEKMKEEWQELEQAVEAGDRDEIVEEFGDFLFAAVNVARFLDLNAEDTMRQAVRKFVRRFKKLEQLNEGGTDALRQLSLQELDELWELAKKEE